MIQKRKIFANRIFNSWLC